MKISSTAISFLISSLVVVNAKIKKQSSKPYCDYWVNGYKSNWYDTLSEALKYGCHLATITSEEDNDRVMAAIDNWCYSQDCVYQELDDWQGQFWIGLYRDEISDDDDEWHWVSGEEGKYENWGFLDFLPEGAQQQPNGGDQTRAYIWGGKFALGEAGTWGDYGPDNEFPSVFKCCMEYPKNLNIVPWEGYNTYQSVGYP